MFTYCKFIYMENECSHLPVVRIADFSAAGDQSGCNDLIRDITPETWGQDMEVPAWKFHFTVRLSNKVGGVSVGHAANIVTPGAVISGCDCLFITIA